MLYDLDLIFQSNGLIQSLMCPCRVLVRQKYANVKYIIITWPEWNISYLIYIIDKLSVYTTAYFLYISEHVYKENASHTVVL
jgi:hypothetical protein